MTETTHHAHPAATGFHKFLKEGTQDLHDQAEAGEFQTTCASHVATLLFASRVCRPDVCEAVQRVCTQVAKWGSPRVLESELKAESKHIRQERA